MTAWTDQFVGDRMAVDRKFSERVAASEFSNQEWGTIMTAVEFHIEEPESPSRAKVVADTSKVDQIIPALEEMSEAMGGAGGGAPGGRGGSGSGRGLDGLFGSIKDSLGLGGGDDSAEKADAATALANEYARQFQEHLQEQGKWERACEVAAATGDEARGEQFEGSSDEEAS